MSNFRVFKQVPRIIFGEASIERLGELLVNKIHETDYHIYVIDDVLKNSYFIKKLKNDDTDFVEWFPASVAEPSTKQIDTLRDKVLNIKSGNLPLSVVGIGGGSTMDVAKALSVMLCNEGSSSKYQGWDLVQNPGIHKIGIPTIAGSGAEASRTSVLMGEDRKFGINSDFSMFDAVILDSELIKTVPEGQRFFSGMDCYIHCVESLQGTMINELSRSYASYALELCKNVFLGNGDDNKLLTASYFGGVSIVNSEVGICHALSYGLSLEFGLRHGLANCIAFNVLDEYYGKSVEDFRSMLKDSEIEMPTRICRDIDSKKLERMIDMTLRMERPLTNALGVNWREIMTPQKISKLYLAM